MALVSKILSVRTNGRGECEKGCLVRVFSRAARSPKVRDLRGNGAFVLHAFLAADDEELQLGGSSTELADPAERDAVHEAIPFPAFDRGDPIFRLEIARALWVYWERVGTPDTKAVRRRWPPRSGAG